MYFRIDERIIYIATRFVWKHCRGKKISKIPRKHGLNGNIVSIVVTMVVTGSLICLLLANSSKMEMAVLLNRTVVSHNPMNISYNSWHARCFIRAS